MIEFRLHLPLHGLPGPADTARERLGHALRRWNWGSPDSLAAAAAVTGDLVNEALRRAGPARDVSMLLTRSGHRLRIAVTSGSPCHTGHRPTAEPDHPWTRRPHAAQWGTESHPCGGTTVWCELLDLPGPRHVPGPRRPAGAESPPTRAERVPAA